MSNNPIVFLLTMALASKFSSLMNEKFPNTTKVCMTPQDAIDLLAEASSHLITDITNKVSDDSREADKKD